MQDDSIFVDSCASRTLLLLCSKEYFNTLEQKSCNVEMAEAGSKLHIEGIGLVGSMTAYYCPKLRRNLVSLGLLDSRGIGFHAPSGKDPRLTDRNERIVMTGTKVLAMPRFSLSQLISILRDIDSVSAVEQGNSLKHDHYLRSSTDIRDEPVEKRRKMEERGSITLPQRGFTDAETMVLWHNRLGHINAKKIADSYARCHFEGIHIPRSMLGSKAIFQLPKCNTCQLSKMRRTSFKPALPDTQERYTGEVMFGDVHVFVNCSAHDGTKYCVCEAVQLCYSVLFIANHMLLHIFHSH